MKRSSTSELLRQLVMQAGNNPVHLEWLLAHLGKRSFALLLFLLGLLVMIPGVATFAAFALLFPSVELTLGRTSPTFPGFLSKRTVDLDQVERFTKYINPLLLVIEQVSKPRWNAHHDVTSPLIGLVVFLLALSANWPLPLVNIIPGIAVIFIAIAYLQEDGVILVFAGLVAMLSLAVSAWTIWSTVGVVTKWLAVWM